jgi:hypothetical protein
MDTQPEETPFAGREDQLAEASQAAFEVPETPTHSTAAPARGKLVDRLAGWTHSFRARPARRETLEALGIRLYGTSRIAPGDELRTRLATLGGALTKVARLAADADQLLGSSDRKALTRRLEDLYAAPASERSVKAADVTAHHISCIDALVARRREFAETSRELEPRLRALPAEIFQARLHHATPPELTTEVTVLLERIQMLTANLEDARAELRACTGSTPWLVPSSTGDARDHTATVEVQLFEEWQPRKRHERDV